MIDILQITAYSTLFIMHEMNKVVVASKTITKSWKDVDTEGLSKLLSECRDVAMTYLAESPLLSQYNIVPAVSIITIKQLEELLPEFGGVKDYDSQAKPATKQKYTSRPDPDCDSRDI